jgi:hypothetical protein
VRATHGAESDWRCCLGTKRCMPAAFPPSTRLLEATKAPCQRRSWCAVHSSVLLSGPSPIGIKQPSSIILVLQCIDNVIRQHALDRISMLGFGRGTAQMGMMSVPLEASREYHMLTSFQATHVPLWKPLRCAVALYTHHLSCIAQPSWRLSNSIITGGKQL